jgi:hypothetical protein
VIGQGYTFFAGRYLGQGTEAFTEPKGEVSVLGLAAFLALDCFLEFMGVLVSYYIDIVTRFLLQAM